MTERIAVPQEVVDARTEALEARLGHTIGALSLLGASSESGRTVDSLLTESVRDGSITKEDARTRAATVRQLVHSAHVVSGGVEGAHDRAEQTLDTYRQGPVPQEDLASLDAVARQHIDNLDQQLDRTQSRTTY